MRAGFFAQILFLMWTGMSYANFDKSMSTAVDAAANQGFAYVPKVDYIWIDNRGLGW